MKEAITAVGIERIGMSAERKCQRKRSITWLTITASSIRSRSSV